MTSVDSRSADTVCSTGRWISLAVLKVPPANSNSHHHWWPVAAKCTWVLAGMASSPVVRMVRKKSTATMTAGIAVQTISIVRLPCVCLTCDSGRLR